MTFLLRSPPPYHHRHPPHHHHTHRTDCHDVLVALELLHRLLDPPQQLPRPQNVPRHCRKTRHKKRKTRHKTSEGSLTNLNASHSSDNSHRIEKWRNGIATSVATPNLIFFVCLIASWVLDRSPLLTSLLERASSLDRTELETIRCDDQVEFASFCFVLFHLEVRCGWSAGPASACRISSGPSRGPGRSCGRSPCTSSRGPPGVQRQS
eukprot:2638029-Rhodomonas_salina.1